MLKMPATDKGCLAELSLMTLLASDTGLTILAFLEKQKTATYTQIRQAITISGEASSYLQKLRHYNLVEFTHGHQTSYSLTFTGKRIMKLVHYLEKMVID